jgi:hypothetical protein
MVGCWCDQEFVARVDACRGSQSRSQFARDALLAFLRKNGVTIPEGMAAPPDRAKKTIYSYRTSQRRAMFLNEGPKPTRKAK